MGYKYRLGKDSGWWVNERSGSPSTFIGGNLFCLRDDDWNSIIGGGGGEGGQGPHIYNGLELADSHI